MLLTGKGESIWDTFVRIPDRIENGATGDDACKSYEKYMEDVHLLKNMGVRRFFILDSSTTLMVQRFNVHLRPEIFCENINWKRSLCLTNMVPQSIPSGTAEGTLEGNPRPLEFYDWLYQVVRLGLLGAQQPSP